MFYTTPSSKGSELLWLIYDSMLVEDPEERFSAGYCHDDALKLLQCMTDTQDLNDDDGSTTSKPSVPEGQSAVEPQSADSEASTFRLDIQSASLDDSGTPIRETVEGVGSSLLKICRSLIKATDFEGRLEAVRCLRP